MKIVREYINEKFKETSDPIEDLGVGGYIVDIQKLFHDFFDKFGNIDFSWNSAGDTVEVFIPYKNKKELDLLRDMLYSVYNIDKQRSSDNRWVIGELDDILHKNKMGIYDTKIVKSHGFKNISKFHKNKRGIIFWLKIHNNSEYEEFD